MKNLDTNRWYECSYVHCRKGGLEYFGFDFGDILHGKKIFLGNIFPYRNGYFLFRIITKSMDEKYIATPKTTQRKLYN